MIATQRLTITETALGGPWDPVLVDADFTVRRAPEPDYCRACPSGRDVGRGGNILGHRGPRPNVEAVDGYPQRVIAEIIGLSEGTVARWISRGRTALRSALGEIGG